MSKNEMIIEICKMVGLGVEVKSRRYLRDYRTRVGSKREYGVSCSSFFCREKTVRQIYEILKKLFRIDGCLKEMEEMVK